MLLERVGVEGGCPETKGSCDTKEGEGSEVKDTGNGGLKEPALESSFMQCHSPETIDKIKIKIRMGGSGPSGGKSVRCLLIGDDRVGKSALVQSFLFDRFDPGYLPTVRDDFTYCTGSSGGGRGGGSGGGVDVDLDICDTGGRVELDRLRPLCYGKTEVVILCYSVVIPSSFSNISRRWLPELKRHSVGLKGGVKLVLVGTQSDLRSNLNTLFHLMDDGLSPVNETRALRLAKKIGAVKYLECSALNRYNVKKVFDLAMTSVLLPPPVTLPLSVSLLQGPSSSPVLGGISKGLGIGGGGTGGISDKRSIFWRRWRLRQKSSKIKRLMLPSCLF